MRRAAKSMWKETGLGGEWKYDSNGAHKILALDTLVDNNIDGKTDHFVNFLPGNKVFDTWSRQIKKYSDVNLAYKDKSGPYRKMKFDL